MSETITAACGVCGATAEQAALRGAGPYLQEQIGFPSVVCGDCLREWYDGETNPEEIKRAVWEARARKATEFSHV